jgi:uncharacterized damage-inducible protein DinB
MKISDTLVPEYQQEMATTRKVLERIPEDKLTWAPHEKSMTMGRLAGHIAEMPGWAVPTMKQDSMDVNPPGGPGYESLTATSRAHVLDIFDKNVDAAVAALAGGSDETYMKTWTLLSGGKPVFSMPRVAIVRVMLLSHVIHHRGQLSVYLRLQNVPVPSIYGPSADEGGM